MQGVKSLPFETFGIPWSSSPWLFPIASVLKRIAFLAESTAVSINDSIVLTAICLPPALIYFLRIGLARILPEVLLLSFDHTLSFRDELTTIVYIYIYISVITLVHHPPCSTSLLIISHRKNGSSYAPLSSC